MIPKFNQIDRLSRHIMMEDLKTITQECLSKKL